MHAHGNEQHTLCTYLRDHTRERCVPLQDSEQTEIFNSSLVLLRTCSWSPITIWKQVTPMSILILFNAF